MPPFSAFAASLMMLAVLGGTAAWGWSLGLLATDPAAVRGLPVWLWTVLLVVAPAIAVPVVLLIAAPRISPRVRRAVGVSVAVAVVVTTGVTAVQQIGVWDCRIVEGRAGVCAGAARSEVVPVGLGVLAAVVSGALVGRRPDSGRMPQPRAT
jgi:hypothetical protein